MSHIDIVPIVFEGTIQECVNFVKQKTKSIVAQSDMVMEGIVCKPRIEIKDRHGSLIITKIKVKDFV